MKKKYNVSALQVSEIFDTANHPLDGTGYLGFVITYPDGRIENIVKDYNQFNYSTVADRIRVLHKKYIHHQEA